MKSMKTLLKLLGAVSLTTVAASSVVACNETNIFKTINNWEYHNGEIYSLVNKNGTIYAGTADGRNRGELFKEINN